MRFFWNKNLSEVSQENFYMVSPFRMINHFNYLHFSLCVDLDSPKDLEVSDPTETTLLLQWKRPLAKFDRYRLTYVTPTGRKNEIEIPADSTSHILRSLDAGIEYTISLVAEKGRHKSKPSTVTGSTGMCNGLT